MAKYWFAWSDETVDTTPSGTTVQFGSGATYTIKSSVDTEAPSGKVLRIVTSSQTRRMLALDALSSDPDRATVKIAILTKYPSETIPDAFSLGGMVRGGGASGNETGVTTGFEKNNGYKTLRGVAYSSGSSTFISLGTDNYINYIAGNWYWIVGEFDGTSVSASVRSAADPETILESLTATTAVTAAGEIGIFTFSSGLTWDVGAISVATGTDDIFFTDPGSTTTPVSFSGPVTTLHGQVSIAFSADVSGYFSGTETPFTYSLLSGTLPAGLSLNTTTGVISGTPTAEGTATGLVIRATDQVANTSDSNSFEVSIAAETAQVKGVSITLHDSGKVAQASVTGIVARWFDSVTGTGAPVFETNTAQTDENGVLVIDLDASTSLGMGDTGYLVLYKAGAAIQEDLHFASRLVVEDVSWV